VTATDTILVPDMIAARAAANPDAVAVFAGTHFLTYRQLLDGATRIAYRLRDIGVDRNHVVGLTGPRSAEGLVGLLGILTSGAAYAYLDPSWPRERRRHVVRECRIRSVVGDSDGVAGLGLATIAVAAPVAAGWCEPPPVTIHRPDDLCYVVYTSGSTGTPKGVAVEHRGVANMAVQLARLFGVHPGVRMLQFASWAWDAAVCEILVTLTAGGTLVLVPDTFRRGGEELAAFLRRQRVNVATLTPSLLAALPHDELPDLHTVVAVGEPCPEPLVTRWTTHGRRFLNGYGPTEATVAVSVGECHPGEPVTVGPPLPGVAVRVVDDAGTPVPVGQSGELWVGGVGLARGYLTDPSNADIDADGAPAVTPGVRFVVDSDGMRWYRTGDVMRQRPDGALDFVGRRDEQVQLHGRRIELAEVTHAIRRYPSVQACAVVVRGGRLVAFVHAGDADLTGPDLAAAAAQWLPPHMIPDIHLVDTWPVNDRGKLDLAVLIAATNTVQPTFAVAVQSPPEGTVADALALVRLLLDDDTVAPDTDFFDAGGHSLLAAQLAVELSQRFGVVVAAQQITEHRTARRLAELIVQPALTGQDR
jgi:amino acid adenylation domain-containing protein